MYTIDDQKEDLYEEDDYDNSWDNRKGLIFKIIIIILCIIVLVWLIKALKSNHSSDNGSVHNANVEKIRLASEDYYFLKNHKDKIYNITLAGLQNEGLINDLVDANNKVCSPTGTNVNLNKDVEYYKMTINLSCSTNDKEEIFYYHRNTLACLNCNGKTYMDGNTITPDDGIKPTPTPTPTPTSTPTPSIEPEKEDNDSSYSCTAWSDWSKERVVDPDLLERVKVLVTGVKYGETKKVYGDWSEYSSSPITKKDGIEIESKVVKKESWSENKTGVNIDTSNSNIRVISSSTITETVNDNSCTSGYVSNGYCYSDTMIGNLTYREYNSGDYIIQKEYCDGAKTLMNSEGLYVLTYLNCAYNKKLGPATSASTYSYTLYTYQTKVTKSVKYYRYREVQTIKEDDHYTDKKYIETELPKGFVKVNGSEEVYYSYKLKTCEK